MTTKRLISATLAIISAIFCACAQTGTWSGELDVQGVKLPLVFHLDDSNPTLDSPAQRAKGIPIQVTRIAPDSISVAIPAVMGAFNGKVDGEQIVGTFVQRGMEFPLVLQPGEPLAARPQTPRPPYPYAQEEVSFANGDAVLKGTLTLPADYTRSTPVIVMVTGSGQQNRDEEIFDHKPFAVIADMLARNGIASLRYDDRGFGESTGDAANCTTEDLMKDALAGVELLRKRFDNVGALGHSEGGTIALMLGERNKVDFIISLAGMVVSGKETLLQQNRYLLQQAGYSQQVVDDYCRILSLIFNGDESVQNELKTVELPAELRQNIEPVLWQTRTPYMQYFLAQDMSKELGGITCPVLALNGTKDTQVFYEPNLKALMIGLPINTKNKMMPMEGLNHLFQHCTTGSINEYATIEETFSPEALDIIVNWIKAL